MSDECIAARQMKNSTEYITVTHILPFAFKQFLGHLTMKIYPGSPLKIGFVPKGVTSHFEIWDSQFF